eukprot:CAMPEP_0174235500 /NCGR_PEP_ID=MMETSP0417-20130205/4921_1 /TAXON_ID=242541 /ORGANISM="Mayorella sp, Strain BSH-02190019" /LENGTH=470 /DNA_ID=CAMNT_0015314009 /DNA_START=66 /DNA_END=1478 /DNA_ORIENTATION=+
MTSGLLQPTWSPPQQRLISWLLVLFFLFCFQVQNTEETEHRPDRKVLQLDHSDESAARYEQPTILELANVPPATRKVESGRPPATRKVESGRVALLLTTEEKRRNEEGLYLYTPTDEAYEAAEPFHRTPQKRLITGDSREVYGDRVLSVDSSVPAFAEHLHVLVFATTLDDLRYQLLRVLIQSFLMHRGTASEGRHYTVWLGADTQSWGSVERLVQRFVNLPCVTFRMFPSGTVQALGNQFAKSNHIMNFHHAGPVLMAKLLVSEIAELQSVHRVLMLDHDMFFLDDIGALFTVAARSLDRNPDAFFAMTAPHRPSYVKPSRLRSPADLYWVPACTLYDLDRMRAYGFVALLDRMLSAFGSFPAATGDQDVFNAFVAQNPSKAVPIHCSWDVWTKFEWTWNDEVQLERRAYNRSEALDHSQQPVWPPMCPHHPKPRVIHYSGRHKEERTLFRGFWEAFLNMPSRFLLFCP